MKRFDINGPELECREHEGGEFVRYDDVASELTRLRAIEAAAHAYVQKYYDGYGPEATGAGLVPLRRALGGGL